MRKYLWLFPAIVLVVISAFGQQRPRVTLDEFFNAVEINSVRMSPAGNAVLVSTSRADWKASRFRNDIWIVQLDGSAPRLLTQSGHDSEPEWSPDGNWVAFISDRPSPGSASVVEPQQPSSTPEPEKPVPSHPAPQQPEPKPQPSAVPAKPPTPVLSTHPFDTALAPGEQEEKGEHDVRRLYVLSMRGGEPVQVTYGREGVHAFAWAADSTALFAATRIPETDGQREQHQKQWADVKRYREDERGDVIQRITLADAIQYASQIPLTAHAPTENQKPEQEITPGTRIAITPYQVSDLIASPDGKTLAFSTDSRSSRLEDITSYEIYLVEAAGGRPRQLTHNEAIEARLHWAPDGRHIVFRVGGGSVEGPYQEVQPRLYDIDVATGAVQRYASDFGGAIASFDLGHDGTVISGGRTGTNVGLYSISQPSASFNSLHGWNGTYGDISIAHNSSRMAFEYSSLQRPTEVYVADSAADVQKARPVTSFNKLFAGRDLPQGRTYGWKSDDGTEVEGMLIYPPGQFNGKHLRMLTLIHGGPEDADGDVFRADWYNWAILAASEGWLVFRPNYRGSTGYGDKFELQIRPDIVSLPGRDILTGVDALVRDGIADPNRLAIGGYSYGGYMTNWLITQTTRFKAAVTGAGAIEHAANWGNDDLTYDDAWYLAGTPWEAENNYNKEAALWQINKVNTPTHMVAGMSDIRVSVLESYLMERAFYTLKVPHTLLLFPGEGHGLGKNPWHGRIKVREELKWLEKYVPGP